LARLDAPSGVYTAGRDIGHAHSGLVCEQLLDRRECSGQAAGMINDQLRRPGAQVAALAEAASDTAPAAKENIINRCFKLDMRVPLPLEV
jgi:hypothetical protein